MELIHRVGFMLFIISVISLWHTERTFFIILMGIVMMLSVVLIFKEGGKT